MYTLLIIIWMQASNNIVINKIENYENLELCDKSAKRLTDQFKAANINSLLTCEKIEYYYGTL